MIRSKFLSLTFDSSEARVLYISSINSLSILCIVTENSSKMSFLWKNRSGSTMSLSPQKSQLPMLNLPDSLRNNLIAVVGEFVGTFLFLFFSFAGTQISNTPKPPAGANPNTSNLLYASLSFGFSLVVNVWAFYRVTGGLFNPSVRVIPSILEKQLRNNRSRSLFSSLEASLPSEVYLFLLRNLWVGLRQLAWYLHFSRVPST